MIVAVYNPRCTGRRARAFCVFQSLAFTLLSQLRRRPSPVSGMPLYSIIQIRTGGISAPKYGGTPDDSR